MSIMQDVQHFREQVEALNKQFKEKVVESLGEMPDNPRITRLGNGCFTIKASDLGDNWSPQHHDSLYQSKVLQEIVDGDRSVDAIIKIFKEVIYKGRINIPKYKNLVFNDDVRAYVKKMLG